MAFLPPPRAFEVVTISGTHSWSRKENKFPDLPSPHLISSKITVILFFFEIAQISFK